MEKLLTTKELVEQLKVNASTIHRWRKEGMPVRKLGTLVRFNYDDVIKWIEEEKNK